MDPLYYYMQYIKFGFGRALRDSSRLIQNKHLNRDKALLYVKKYDGEFPEEDLHKILEYLDCSLIEFNENIEKHRNSEIWHLKGNEYKLNFDIK